ncbi:MAG: KH domain-containing protein [Candidatus Goldbacteria bacterium]|nr:KH domain-containing protein [Candidatus Goldiibacteriota bacterium]
MSGIRKVSGKISDAVADFIKDEDVPLDRVSVNLINEKVFTDRIEYTVELFKRENSFKKNQPAPLPAVQSALEMLGTLLKLSGTAEFSLKEDITPDSAVIKIHTPFKNGLLIGKDGQNISALQYLISTALEQKFRTRFPVILDIDSYREKHKQRLINTASTMITKAQNYAGEWLTELMPSFDRKVIHEECASAGIKTFSIGRGVYKKVVVTSLL